MAGFQRVFSITLVFLLTVSVSVYAQTSQPEQTSTSKPDREGKEGLRIEGGENPAQPGFDLEGSDRKAIEIADRAMRKMGGRKAWDETRYITWKFFGRRFHVWDKQTGNIRVEYDSREGEHHVLLANLHSHAGSAWIDGSEVLDQEQLKQLMKSAISAWINDSYWLVMPYKLKDTGVTLKYSGEAKMEDGQDADVLQLTFKDVGNTPQNKYDVYVAKDTGLVEQWAFYSTAEDDDPRFTIPWKNWKKYGHIMLSDDRGLLRGNPAKHTDIAVFEELPGSVFTDPSPVDLKSDDND